MRPRQHPKRGCCYNAYNICNITRFERKELKVKYIRVDSRKSKSQVSIVPQSQASRLELSNSSLLFRAHSLIHLAKLLLAFASAISSLFGCQYLVGTLHPIYGIADTRRAADSLAMFWPVQQLCGVIRVFGSCTSSCLRSIGTMVSPATSLADTVDVTLMRMGLLENTESALEQDSSTKFFTIKKNFMIWMVLLHFFDGVVDLDAVCITNLTACLFKQDRQILNAILATAATIWSGPSQTVQQ